MTVDHTGPQNSVETSARIIKIFDTTLRDGEQAPGFTMTAGQKLRMAEMLCELGVDVMEAGFAAASPGDFDAIKRIAGEVKGPTICSLARATEGDIRQAGESTRPAARNRIHIFLGSSPTHREFKLNMTKAQVLEKAAFAVAMGKDLADEVEFSPEDAIRTETDFLLEVIATAVDAGADIINVPDTVGYATPDEIRDLFRTIKATLPDGVTLSAHCHDDLGMAVANSLAAAEGGAEQIECTINGIGERAGNASLEEIVMAMKVRSDIFGLDTRIDTTKLYPASRLLTTLTGQPVQRNKAITGRNAFAHESGIHQHGVLKNRETYEIMRAEDIGVSRDNIVLGKHSGRAALAERAERLGYSLGENQLQSVFVAFKEVADRKKEVFDSDLEALILGETTTMASTKAVGWTLAGIHAGSGYGDNAQPYGSVELVGADGERQRDAGEGDGPIDAIFGAIQRITGVDVELVDFQIRALSTGSDALGEADVHVMHEGQSYHGRGVDTDIVAAGARAFLDTVNRIIRTKQRQREAGLAETPAKLSPAVPPSAGTPSGSPAEELQK